MALTHTHTKLQRDKNLFALMAKNNTTSFDNDFCTVSHPSILFFIVLELNEILYPHPSIVTMYEYDTCTHTIIIQIKQFDTNDDENESFFLATELLL